MHTLIIISVGKTKEAWLQEAWEEYSKRLRPLLKFQNVWLQTAKELDQYLLDHPHALLLDPTGLELDSPQLHGFLYHHASLQKGRIELVIGADRGFDAMTRETARKQKRLISLSRLTFTHQMCRLLLIEQVYRCMQIEHATPYHK